MGAEPTRERRAMQEGSQRPLDDEGTEARGELLFGKLVFD